MSLWIGYAKAGKEFDVQEALREIGITCHVARKVTARRSGKHRRPEAVESPVLPNYVFIDVSVDRYLDLASIKHLANTKTMVGKGDATLIIKFLSKAADVYDRETARIAAGERISLFSAGDAMEILGGPLVGHMARFKAIVAGENQAFDRIRGEVDLMGRVASVELDPLDVRAAE